MKITLLVAGLLTSLSPVRAWAEAPQIQTPSPVIYLADNLDEKDNLGWCIDTLGRGFAENLQAHSCKPQGGDVQFSFDAETGLIRNVEFSKFCMQHNAGNKPVFGLVPCDAKNNDQQFSYTAETQSISPASNDALCVSVAKESRTAGPFMSRSLLLETCAETDAKFRTWIIANDQ